MNLLHDQEPLRKNKSMRYEAVKSRKRRARQVDLVGHEEVKRQARARYAAGRIARGQELRVKRLQVLSPPAESTVNKRTSWEQEGTLSRIFFRMKGTAIDLTSATDLAFFFTPAPIIDFIMTKDPRLRADNTKVTYLANIIGFFKHREGFDEARPVYTAKMNEVKTLIDVQRSYNKITEGEIGSFLPFSQLLASYETVKDPADRLLMALYLKTPPRRLLDYMHMKVDSGIATKNTEYNYATPSTFVFNRYKTMETYGQQKVPIPAEIKKLIKAMHYKRGSFMFPQKLNPSKPADFGMLLTSVFKRHTGLSITINGLRKSYVSSHTSEKSNFDLQKLATQMGTSAKELYNYKRMPLIEH